MGDFRLAGQAPKARHKTVSIPMRDYGGFSQIGFISASIFSECFNPYEGLWGIFASLPQGGGGKRKLSRFNPYEGVWGIFAQCA